MKYKFVSREQTKKDWEEGKVQCEHGAAGKSEKLDKLFGHSFYAGRYEHYNYIDGRCNYNSNIPTATTDELYEWIYGEEQRELLGYKLNGKIGKSTMEQILFTCSEEWDDEILLAEDMITKASELGVLSTCFDPVYKPYQIEVKLSDYNVSVEKDIAYLISLDKKAEWPIKITDLKKIIEAHDKL